MSGDGWGNLTQKLPLPDPIDPGEFVCYLVRVPKSKFHITAFLGAIYDLSVWYNWERDALHRATQAAQVWRKIWEALRPQDCTVNPGALTSMEVDDLMPLRVDCNCDVFVTCCDGSEVQLLTSRSPNAAQPGVGSPQPAPGGGQASYPACVQANQQWLIPFPLTTGDEVEFLNPSGAWNDPDSDGPVYRCSDGSIYFAGACLPDHSLVPADPLNTATHMTILVKIGSTYLNVGAGPVIIPVGHSNENAFLIPNDSVRSNDNGTICGAVRVTNNQGATWSHTFDFAIAQNGWSPANNGNGPLALYIPGTGWQSVDGVDAPGETELGIQIVFPARSIASVRVFYNATGASNGAAREVLYQIGAGALTLYGNLDAGAGTFDTTISASVAGVTLLRAQVDRNFGTMLSHVTKIIATGLGSDPF